MKQTQANPWDQVAGKYPPGTMVEGTVRNLTNYGAFIEIEEGIDGLLHVCDMSWTRKIGHPNEVLEKGERDHAARSSTSTRSASGSRWASSSCANDPWETDIPGRYEPGDVVKGKVTKLTNFGVFVELEPGLEGLLHISELADHKVDSPEEVVKVGDEIEVKILRVDRGERKIGLSRKKAQWTKPDDERGGGAPSAGEPADAAKAKAKETKELKGGLGGGGPLFSMGGASTAPRPRPSRSRSPSPDSELPTTIRSLTPASTREPSTLDPNEPIVRRLARCHRTRRLLSHLADSAVSAHLRRSVHSTSTPSQSPAIRQISPDTPISQSPILPDPP